MRFWFVPALTLSGLAYLAPTPSRSAALDDSTIVAIFDAANTYDIETGHLALQKSHTKAVRDLAQQFMSDHKALRQHFVEKAGPAFQRHLEAVKQLQKTLAAHS